MYRGINRFVHRVMFAPESPATILQLADDFKEEITQLRIIPETAITAEFWLRSTQGTWRFFLISRRDPLTGIDRGGKPPRDGIRTADCLNIRDYCRRGWLPRPETPCGNSGTSGPATGPVIPLFPQPPDFRGHNSQKCGTGPE